MTLEMKIRWRKKRIELNEKKIAEYEDLITYSERSARKKELIKADIKRRKQELPKLKEELKFWESML